MLRGSLRRDFLFLFLVFVARCFSSLRPSFDPIVVQIYSGVLHEVLNQEDHFHAVTSTIDKHWEAIVEVPGS